MHGARALVRVSRGGKGGLWAWIDGLLARRPFDVVVAAVANKLARIAWVLLSRGETYRAAAACEPARRRRLVSGERAKERPASARQPLP